MSNSRVTSPGQVNNNNYSVKEEYIILDSFYLAHLVIIKVRHHNFMVHVYCLYIIMCIFYFCSVIFL